MIAEGGKKKKKAHNFDRQQGPFTAKQQPHLKTDDKDVSQQHLLRKECPLHWNRGLAQPQRQSAVKAQKVDSCVLAPAAAGPLHFQPAYDTELAAQSQLPSSCLSRVSTASSRDDGFTSCPQRFLSLQSPAPRQAPGPKAYEMLPMTGSVCFRISEKDHLRIPPCGAGPQQGHQHICRGVHPIAK